MSGTLAELIARANIREVYVALGGKLVGGRGQAFWRNGKRPNVGFNVAKGAWSDYKTGDGGGIIDLICRALGCDRKTAAQWLSDYTGIPLANAPASPAQRRAMARKWAAERAEREAVEQWRDELLEAMRRRRNTALWAYHRGLSTLNRHPLEAPIGQYAADVVETCSTEYKSWDARIAALENATLAELLPLYREQNRRAA